MKNGTKRNIAAGALLAAAAGFVAGILTAPKSGRETRQDIKSSASHGITEAEKQLKKLHTELNDTLATVKVKGKDASGKAKAEVDDLVKKAKVAKDKTREVLSAIHEGDASDADLKKAVIQAQHALKNLKVYLAK